VTASNVPDLGVARHLLRQARARHADRPEMVRGLHVPYTRRGVMSIPAFKMKPGGDPATDGRTQSHRVMQKATSLPVDCFFYDLEDAAPDHEELKPLARRFAIEMLRSLDFGRRVVGFRPNNIRTRYFEEDMLQVVSEVGHRLQVIVLPKTETFEEVRDVCTILDEICAAAGHTNRIKLEVLIESPRAFVDAERIAALPQVSALVLGSWDFARTVGGRVDAQTWLSDQAVIRQSLVILAAAHGKDAVDAITGTLPIRPAPPPGLSDDDVKKALAGGEVNAGEAFSAAVRAHQDAVALARRDAADARRLGFAAKWILHPDQIDAIQSAWTPTRDEALRALKLTADYARAAVGGSGAELQGQQLADKAVIGTEWWLVEAALQAGVLLDADVVTTGLTMEALRRTGRTRD